jgi:hypothetical protein
MYAVLAALALSLAVQAPNLDQLYEKREFFDLRDALPRSAPDSETDFFKGAVANKFNRLHEAATRLQAYVRSGGRYTPEALELLADTYAKQGRYGQAADTYRRLLTRTDLTKTQRTNAQNVADLWGAFRSVPPQQVTLKEDLVIKRSAGTPRGLYFPVEANGKNHEILVDTGANISTVILSFAKELNMRIIPAKIMIGSITGKQVPAQLGVMPVMKIGSATVQNAIFLVMEDKEFTFGDFVLKGVIGFPIIEALGELTFFRDGSVTVHAKPSATGEQNLFLEGLTPHVYGHYKGQRLVFGFDTGASNTDIYYPFLKRFEGDVRARSEVRRTRVGGAGGSKEPLVHHMKDFALRVGGQPATIPTVRVHPEINREEERYVNGNLGQDLIRQFNSMTINWRTMSLRFDK